MILQFSKKHWLIMIMLIFIVGLGFAGFYYFNIMPKNDKLEQLNQSIETEEKILASFENKQPSKSKIYQDSRVLQQKVPVKPIVEQFILDIEKAEIVSKSFIKTMSFSDADITPEQQQAENNGQATDNHSNNENGTNESQNEKSGEHAVPNQPSGSFPEGMKRVIVNLSVESPDYYAMESFLQTIEDLERITKIDSLSFSGPEERTSLEGIDEEEKLTYSLTISTFYHPGLEELYEEVPPFDIPEPGHKTNPLTHAGSTSDAGNELTEEGTVTEDREQANSAVFNQLPTKEKLLVTDGYKIIKHEITAGESLYTISKQYYQDINQGIELLKEQNGLVDDAIYEGQTIKIPILN